MKILILTPTLGVSEFMSRTLDSVNTLKVSILHVIISSSDKPIMDYNCSAHCERIWLRDNGAGMYAALNQGLLYALDRNDWGWLTYLNDDDELLVNDFDTFRTVQGVVYGNAKAIGVESEKLFDIPISRSPSHLFRLAKHGVVGVAQQGLFIDRKTVESIGFFDSSYRYAGDLDLIMRFLRSGIKFNYTKHILGSFRICPGQLSKSSEKMCSERERILLAYPDDNGSDKFYLLFFVFKMQNLPKYFSRVLRYGFTPVRKIYEI